MTYTLRIVPAVDYVDLEMTITNLSDEIWHEVFAFNCVSPARAPAFEDSAMQRTYMQVQGQPQALAHTTRIQGRRPGMGIYAVLQHTDHMPPFAEAFQATSPNQSDGAWMAKIADTGDAYMATTTQDALFLFNNTNLGCIHAAPNFGDIEPADAVTVSSRVYFAKGSLQDFIKRYDADHLSDETK
jgi:hypothetical protein